MNIKLIQEDITKLSVEAVVNAANSKLAGGGGVDGAIHKAAGKKNLLKATSKFGGCPTGEAVITDGFNLPAKYIIHTVGPVWNNGNNNEKELLESAYKKSLKLAAKYKLKSIAFPNISTGVYGFPKNKAAEIAVNSVKDFVYKNNYDIDVYFVCFDDENYEIYNELLA